MRRTLYTFVQNLLFLSLAVLLSTQLAIAAYKPVDISDITGEQRKELMDAKLGIASMPTLTRDLFFCEQLGLLFRKDGSCAMLTNYGYPGTNGNTCFVGRSGHPENFDQARTKAVRPQYDKCYERVQKFKRDAVIGLFKKEVECCILNTAKYLLMTMTEEDRWMLLASMGNMLYNEQETSLNHERSNCRMDCGITVSYAYDEGRGYSYLDPAGREHDIRAYLKDGARAQTWRWRQIVWRCENLVGAKDILALFPDEVKAMRKAYKQRVAGIAKKAEEAKTEQDARNEAMLNAADDILRDLPEYKRVIRITRALGLYYKNQNHQVAGKNVHYHWMQVGISSFNPDGTLTKENDDQQIFEIPTILQQIPHEAILEHYRDIAEKAARAIAERRFKEMPPVLRDLLRAWLSGKLIKADGSSAGMKEDVRKCETFDRYWTLKIRYPQDPAKTYFLNSDGRKMPFTLYDSYKDSYRQTITLTFLCAHILGKKEVLQYIPAAGDAAAGASSPESGTRKSDADSATREGAEPPQNPMLTQGQTALADMTPERRRAWLAEHLGFCYTNDGRPAYQSERTANNDALFVDADGKERNLSEAAAKSGEKWITTTNAARALNYSEQLTANWKDELEDIACRTAYTILSSMPADLRQSWLAARNQFFFLPDMKNPYGGPVNHRTLESGVKVTLVGTWDYGKCLYYDPIGKIAHSVSVSSAWDKRWLLLYLCESLIGIEAINSFFPDEVNAMREHYEKSPFYRK